MIIKDQLQSKDRLLYVGVHNALSAKIAEEAGVDGVWISSFELSATYGLPDADILTMDDYCRVIESIADKITIPILVDANDGFGSAVEVMRLVKKYERSGANGIVIEDNLFPKECSFYEGDKHLEDPIVFCGKLLAAKENSSDNFFVAARTEALIANRGIDNAIRRAELYSKYSDAIVVHSKNKDGNEIFEFGEKWNKRTELIAIPTTYNSRTYDDLNKVGYKFLILPNYGIRSTVKTLQRVFKKVVEAKSLSEANDEVVDMQEIFRLVNLSAQRNIEETYIKRFK
jgi:phosphoenolpyruvate phosphomutase